MTQLEAALAFVYDYRSLIVAGLVTVSVAFALDGFAKWLDSEARRLRFDNRILLDRNLRLHSELRYANDAAAAARRALQDERNRAAGARRVSEVRR